MILDFVDIQGVKLLVLVYVWCPKVDTRLNFGHFEGISCTKNDDKMSCIQIKIRKDAKRKDGSFPLYAFVSFGKTKVRFCIKVYVYEKNWDPVNQRIKGNSKIANDTNLIISNARARISDILVKARLSNKPLTGSQIISFYNLVDGGMFSEGDIFSFVKFSYEYLIEIDRSIEYSTMVRRKGMIKKIEDYDRDVTFNDMTPEWLRRFSVYCREELGNSEMTIKKNIDTIRLFYRVALRRGLAQNDPFDYFKCPACYSDVIFLTEEELKMMISLRDTVDLSDMEELVLDSFLFMAFSGMHYSDAAHLRIDSIKNGEIQYKRQKTGTLVKVPLSKPASILVKKYIGLRRRGLIFPDFPSNQNVNRVLKDLAAKAGINKNICAKTGRHTFATLFYKKTKDIGTLSKLLGHTSVKNTMIYAHIMREDRFQGISVFDDIRI